VRVLYGLKVRYLADEKSYPYSGILSRDGGTYMSEPNTGKGFYTNFDTCASDIANQTARFEQQTGTMVVGVSCLPANGYASEGFYMQLDGFWKKDTSPEAPKLPLRKLYAFSVDPQEGRYPEVPNAVLAVLNKQGLDVVVGGEQGFFLYYGARPAELRVGRLAYVDEYANCVAQQQDAANIFTASGATMVFPLCLANIVGEQVGSAHLTVIGDGYSTLTDDYGNHSPKYYSFGECMNDKARYMEELKANYRNPLGIICELGIGGPKGHYVGKVYSKLY